MKHTINIKTLLVVLIALMLTLAGCTQQAENPPVEKTKWEKIQESGVMTVGTSPDYPPFETIDDNGNIVGFDIDVLNEIAKILGVTPEVKEMSFDTIITAVQNDQLDIGMSCFSISPERLENVDMSEPYLVSGQVVVTMADSQIKSVADLAGKKVAVGIGTTGEQAAGDIEGVEIVSLDDYNVGFIMLKNGSVDAVVADIPVANDYVKKDEGYVIMGDPIASEETAIVIKKGNEDLVNAINQAILELKQNGKIDEIKENWSIE